MFSCVASTYLSAVARPIVLLTYRAISWPRSGDPCENVALNKRGVFNRETESSGGMLAGSVQKLGVSFRYPCLNLETVRFAAGRIDHSPSSQSLRRAWDLRPRMTKRRAVNYSAFCVNQTGTLFRPRNQSSPGRIRTYNLAVNSRSLYH